MAELRCGVSGVASLHRLLMLATVQCDSHPPPAPLLFNPRPTPRHQPERGKGDVSSTLPFWNKNQVRTPTIAASFRRAAWRAAC